MAQISCISQWKSIFFAHPKRIRSALRVIRFTVALFHERCALTLVSFAVAKFIIALPVCVCGGARREFISLQFLCVLTIRLSFSRILLCHYAFSRNAHATVFRLERLRTIKKPSSFLRRGLFNVMHVQKAFAPPTRRERGLFCVARPCIRSGFFCIPILVYANTLPRSQVVTVLSMQIESFEREFPKPICGAARAAKDYAILYLASPRARRRLDPNHLIVGSPQGCVYCITRLATP